MNLEDGKPIDRAGEVSKILQSLQEVILPYIKNADNLNAISCAIEEVPWSPRRKPVLEQPRPPDELAECLCPTVPHAGLGADGLMEAARSISANSVNTWDPGFLDKLYASTDAPGVAAELLLAVLNTNVHVYAASPALTLIEKFTAESLARLFGFTGPNAGGVTLPGGTASNTTAMLVARNYLFPRAKTEGMASLGKPAVVFTSAESHYSISIAAAQLGLGTRNVETVRAKADGSMDPVALRTAVESSLSAGRKPFYVCATAGTTVAGAYDPLTAIAQVCKEYGLWMHVDGCWGGAAVFSPRYRRLLSGIELADSISFNPHKMLGVPLTCSFLLGADMRQFYFANNLEAGYLFHDPTPETHSNAQNAAVVNGSVDPLGDIPAWSTVVDLAKFTGQCGRRGDSLKMYLAWQYYGNEGFARNVEAAFAGARQLAAELAQDTRVVLLNGNPPPCCQVCFRYVGVRPATNLGPAESKQRNSMVTRRMVAALLRRGWKIDYTTGDAGEYLRVVCNRNTTSRVVAALVRAIIASGEESLAAL